jgi:hypothetical protein
MEELVPIGFGLLLGAALSNVRSPLRVPLGLLSAVALGVTATAVTGEAAISWAFVVVDIPLVAFAALLGRLIGRRLWPVARRGLAGRA